VDGRATPYSLPRAPAERRWSLYLAHGLLPAAHRDPRVATKTTLEGLEAWIAAGGLP
jgi:hypothetical protein